ncbi:MAG: DNA gyrase inhibitor YacG [Planctomycetota bacterium]
MAGIQCPTCQRSFDPGEFKFGPFCSERCQQIDLGRWLRESYSFPATRDPEDGEGHEAAADREGGARFESGEDDERDRMRQSGASGKLPVGVRPKSHRSRNTGSRGRVD